MNHDEPLNLFGISLFFDAGSYGCSSQHIPMCGIINTVVSQKWGPPPLLSVLSQTEIITSQLNKNEAEHMKTNAV